MKTIHKYKLEPVNGNYLYSVSIPKTHTILDFNFQNQDPFMYAYLWALVDTDTEFVKREFYMFPTGLELPGSVVWLKTIYSADREFVLHIFKK